MPGLLRAEKIARTAYFKVAHGDLVARAELRKIAYGVQALFRVLIEHLVAPEREVSRCAAGRAADAPAYLVQLRQPQPVRVLDDEGVDVGYVDTGFDNGGAYKYLHLARRHALHDVCKHGPVHLPVRHRNRRLAVQKLAYAHGGAVNVVDAVMEVVDLPAALQLAAHRVGKNAPVVLHHEGLHRQAVFRRLVDGGHIAYAGHRHVERARYGRRRERQHVHAPAQLLYMLLVRHAEALLLVHDEKPQILEVYVL